MRRLSQRFRQPDWWTAFFSGVVAITAACALWYAHSQIKEAHEEAQIQHLLALVHEFDQEPMATYRKELADKRLNTKDDDPKELYRVLDFYETVGRLAERGYLNDEDVWNQFGYWVLHLDADADMRENVEFEQKRDPTEYAVYGSLVERLKQIDAAQHGGKAATISKEQVMDFYREELAIDSKAPVRTHGHSSRPEK